MEREREVERKGEKEEERKKEKGGEREREVEREGEKEEERKKENGGRREKREEKERDFCFSSINRTTRHYGRNVPKTIQKGEYENNLVVFVSKSELYKNYFLKIFHLEKRKK